MGIPNEPPKPAKPQPLLTAFGALLAAGALGYFVVDAHVTGVVALGRGGIHFSRDTQPLQFWTVEIFLGLMALLALGGVVVALRALFVPERPAKGRPPEWK